jgi:ABC-type transporter Mla MlaB component
MHTPDSSPPASLPPTTSAPGPSRYGEVCVLLYADEAVVWLHGEIDLAVREELDETVHDLVQANLPVRVDASRVTFADSAAVYFLGRLFRAGLSVRVHDPADHLSLLLRLVGAPAALVAAVQTSTPYAVTTLDESATASGRGTAGAVPVSVPEDQQP